MTHTHHRLCLLTGATGGLGRCLAENLIKAGYRLFITGRQADALAQLATTLDALPGCTDQTQWLATDLTTPQAVEQLATTALQRSGTIDILINNAGIFPVGPFLNLSMDEYDRCFNINVRAPIQLSRLLLPAMVEQKWGRLVHIGSSSAYAGFKNTALYCATKHALLGFSRSLHDELREQNVRSIALSPGSLQTEMGRQVPGQDFSTFIDPQEVANYLIFLLSFTGNMISEEVRLNRVIIR